MTLGLPDRGSEPARDTRVATAKVAVFVVTAAKDAEGQLDYDWDGGMMGAGFQEETYSPGNPPQERLPPALASNPFLNARSEDAPLPPRYGLTRDSIVLGPSAGETRDFALVPLETEVDGFGWRAPTCLLTLSFQNVAESNPVSFLLDTGIPEMLIFLAESRRLPGLPPAAPGFAAAAPSPARTDDRGRPSGEEWRRAELPIHHRQPAAGADPARGDPAPLRRRGHGRQSQHRVQGARRLRLPLRLPPGPDGISEVPEPAGSLSGPDAARVGAGGNRRRKPSNAGCAAGNRRRKPSKAVGAAGNPSRKPSMEHFPVENRLRKPSGVHFPMGNLLRKPSGRVGKRRPAPGKPSGADFPRRQPLRKPSGEDFPRRRPLRKPSREDFQMRQLPWKPSDTDFPRRKLPWKPSGTDSPRRQLSWKPSGTDFPWRQLLRKPSETGGAIGAPVAGRESGGSKPLAAALPRLQPALATVTFGVTGLDPDDGEVNMSKADRGIRMAAALEKLAAASSPGVASIEDPVAWQREVRSDRQSAADAFRLLASLPEDFMSEGRRDEPPQEREPD